MTNPNPWARKLALNPISPTIKRDVHIAIANNSIAESIALPDKLPPDTRQPSPNRVDGNAKLSRLIDDDFPFDESQLTAINGMVNHRYACLTGAAGTGKTTVSKGFVDKLLQTSGISEVDMEGYFKSGYEPDDSEDDYVAPERWVPSVVMVGFTGRSTQMTKQNFPRDWHGNIMTIHRMLAYAPEWYDVIDENSGIAKKKMRFVPTYTADCLLPWDIIIIDEAGMVGLELWHQIFAAMKQGCRVYMIGDINQLPPVHGRSVFGFAMSKWPTWELTHIHRQSGKDNPIVDNAWRVLQGQTPISGGNFQMQELKGDAQLASRYVRAWVPKLKEIGVYEPNRDTIITPINGEDGSRGFALGQLPLNREFAVMFNPRSQNPRYIIDGGRDRKMFAIGDKVMATRNDHEIGVTNGMTGIIVDIIPHEGYGGDAKRFGLVEDVNKYIADTGEHDDDESDFSLEEMESAFEAREEAKDEAKESRDRGPASHIVTVRFGSDEHGFEVPFSTLAEVGSLMTAYVVTCHKMQGGESPTVIIILHDSHKQMLEREWLYTAITRASQRCIIFYTKDALRVALGRQAIKGKTLKEKIAAFARLCDKSGPLGAAVTVRIPEAEELEIHNVDRTQTIQQTPSKVEVAESEPVQPVKVNPFASLARPKTN